MTNRGSSSPSSLVEPPEVPARWRDLFGLIPGYDPVATAAPGEWFDEDAAQTAIDFFPECLQFIEGERAGQPFVLEPWQQALVGCLFGWKREDGTRRYREALVFVPRKNGKTPTAAGIVLLSLFTEHEPGSQIYSAAADKDQAALIFRHAAGMIAREPLLAGRAKIYRTYKSIEYRAEGSIYKALSSESNTKHGLGANLVIVDELHTHPDSDLVDVLKTSTAARRQPMMIYITTSDYERESVCNKTHDYASKVRDRIIEDSSFLPAIWEAKTTDNWTDPAVWARCNPNLGVSVKLEYLERECQRAQDEPSYENTFKRLHLDIRTEQDVRWLQMEKWDACAGVEPAGLDGATCYMGLDLATTTDIAAAVLFFPDTGYLLSRFWIPGDCAEKREKRDRVPYMTWAREGYITMTPGNVIDYKFIRSEINDLCARFNVVKIAYDPYNAQHLAQQLQDDDGLPMVEHRQGFISMNEPAKHFERLVISGGLNHGGNPILRWMASNVMVKVDPAGSIKPDKNKSTEKIDGIVSSIMAVGLAMTAEAEPVFNPGVA